MRPDLEDPASRDEPEAGRRFSIHAPYWVLLACSILLAILKVQVGLELPWIIVLLPVILVMATAALVALTAFLVAGVAGVRALLRRR